MQLIAEKRETFGKKNKNLRKQGSVPAVVFGKGMESIPVYVSAVDYAKVYAEAGETNLVDLIIDGNTEKVLIKEAQLHPVSSKVLHVNFHKVDLKTKINADIPVEVVGEEQNELIKGGEALALLLINEITISALPTDLPNEFTVDVSGLQKIGDGITAAQLDYDREKVELLDIEDDELVVKLDYAIQEEEPEEELSEEELLAQMEVTEEAKEEDEAETEDGSDKSTSDKK